MGRPKKRPPPLPGPTRLERLTTDLEAAQDRQQALVAETDETIAGARARALQSQRAWDLQSLILQERGQVDEAARAARASTQAGELAARLERDTLADRVAALERQFAADRAAGARLRRLVGKE